MLWKALVSTRVNLVYMDSRNPLLVLHQLSMRSPEGLIEAPENQFYWFAAQTQKTSQVQEWCWCWWAVATVQCSGGGLRLRRQLALLERSSQLCSGAIAAERELIVRIRVWENNLRLDFLKDVMCKATPAAWAHTCAPPGCVGGQIIWSMHLWSKQEKENCEDSSSAHTWWGEYNWIQCPPTITDHNLI